ncbi:Hypothetical protein PHPALM_15448 [Phytophthora palmivora]|uniref:Uncharacterized protein n=1 Tax=Phytophthora palmivora TaxID=4796 RepID=A0A2P4XSA7_9STRA|nr:Hypothetical protein PHPALM_15448 [Phytophthora palmivora]
MSSEIRDIKAHYQDQVEALKVNKAALKYQVADLQAQVSILKSRPDVKPTDPWGFQNHWTTIIHVTALDERKKPVPDFKERLSKERALQESQVSRVPSKSQARKLSPKRPFKSDLRRLQRRPSGHQPVEDSVLSANAGTKVAKSEVHKKLPGDVVKKEVRPDLRQALLSSVAYDKAMEWLASDKEAHSLFSSPVLVQMLVSVIFSRHLDSTPWNKYVPEVYHQMADEMVDRHILVGTEHAAWGDLDGHVNYPDSDVESTVDNPKEDPDYKDPRCTWTKDGSSMFLTISRRIS